MCTMCYSIVGLETYLRFFFYYFSAQATLEGVYEEYNKRSAYIAYLVKSQQKFQDAKLQVAAVQTSVDR